MQQLATPDKLLAQMAEKLKTLLSDKAIENPLMVGIHTGGVWVATRLHQQLNNSTTIFSEPLASLDISFYRDDFSRIGMNPKVKPSQLPPDVDDRHIIRRMVLKRWSTSSVGCWRTTRNPWQQSRTRLLCSPKSRKSKAAFGSCRIGLGRDGLFACSN